MHISLDGFVAGPNGEMDWINVDPEIFEHVEKRISQTDTALYGRVTFQMMESYWPTAADKPDATTHDRNHSIWYAGAKKIVLSNTLRAEDFDNTKIIRQNLVESINSIKQSNADESDEILLFGSPTATHALIQNNLIDGYWLFVNPVLLGKGISLFTSLNNRIKLKRSPETHQFTNGVIELNYLVE